MRIVPSATAFAPLVLFALLLGGTGCASTAKTSSAASISAADYALRKAAERDLDERSQVVILKAQDKLEKSRALREDGKHVEAEQLADEVTIEAQLADAMATNTQAHAVETEIKAGLDALRAEAERMSR